MKAGPAIDAGHGGPAAGERRWLMWLRRRSAAWVSVPIALCVLELTVRTGVLNPQFFPPVVETFGELAQRAATGEFWTAVGDTMQSWALGLGLAAVLAIPVGIAIGSSYLLWRSVRPIVEFLRPMPTVALFPAAVLLFGIGHTSKIILVTFSIFWIVLIHAIEGVKNVDPIATDTARSWGFGRWRRFWWVTLPSASPTIATGLRIASSVAILVAIAVELVIGAPGLGRTIQLAQGAGAVEVMYAYVVAAGLLGWGLNELITRLERKALYWHASYRGSS